MWTYIICIVSTDVVYKHSTRVKPSETACVCNTSYLYIIIKYNLNKDNTYVLKLKQVSIINVSNI